MGGGGVGAGIAGVGAVRVEVFVVEADVASAHDGVWKLKLGMGLGMVLGMCTWWLEVGG